jgi:hypothetical protein
VTGITLEILTGSLPPFRVGGMVETMTRLQFTASLANSRPPQLPPELLALWWDAKGDWARAHACVDDLETPAAMAVHAYLHRKEGVQWNADYWYRRAGKRYHRSSLEEEHQALLQAFTT